MNLTTKQREALRAIHDGDSLNGVHHRTFQSLLDQGLTYRTRGRRGSRAHWALTSQGTMVYEDIMESGDGPEALKALLRF